MAKHHIKETRLSAKMLFGQGYTLAEIEDKLRVPQSTLYEWRRKDRWDETTPANDTEQAIARRICYLTDKPDKTQLELDEYLGLIDKFGDYSVKLATARGIDKGTIAAPPKPGKSAPVPTPAPGEQIEAAKPEGEREGRGRRKKAVKNDVSGITPEMLAEVREKIFFRFGYQKTWWDIKHDPIRGQYRFILKSRQIGATYYFAWEAFEDAILTGDNQIFLSSSRDQAEVFKAYIIVFAKKFFNIELKGSRFITLSNDAELRFVSTNASTAASYHGHLYVDEVFWIPNFDKVWEQASGMASHDKWRITVFSVPSAKSHPAYKMWSGADYNEGKPEHEHFSLDIDYDELHNKLKNGWLGPDLWWRHIVTVVDAERAGCDLFNIEKLRIRSRTQDAFDNKYMCRFIDDAKSVFSLALLLACGVPVGSWKDFNPLAARPFGNKPVAMGYDPSRTGDNASVVVLAVPTSPEDKWRLLERIDMQRVSHEYQADRIKEICKKYNVVHIGIDITGEGRGVLPYLNNLPCVHQIMYNVNTKMDLIINALDVVQPPSRFEYYEEYPNDKYLGRDMVHSLLMIKKAVTPGTNQVTYKFARNSTLGHGDLAAALTHGMIFIPINSSSQTATVAFSKSKH